MKRFLVYLSVLLAAIVGIALAVCFAVVIPCSGLIMDVFRGADSTFDPAAYRALGGMLFVVMFVREFAEALFCVSVGALRGVGDTRYVMAVQCSIEVFLRVPLIFLVSALSQSVYLLWLTMPLDIGVISTLLVRRWLSGRWRTVRLVT